MPVTSKIKLCGFFLIILSQNSDLNNGVSACTQMPLVTEQIIKHRLL